MATSRPMGAQTALQSKARAHYCNEMSEINTIPAVRSTKIELWHEQTAFDQDRITLIGRSSEAIRSGHILHVITTCTYESFALYYMFLIVCFVTRVYWLAGVQPLLTVIELWVISERHLIRDSEPFAPEKARRQKSNFTTRSNRHTVLSFLVDLSPSERLPYLLFRSPHLDYHRHRFFCYRHRPSPLAPTAPLPDNSRLQDHLTRSSANRRDDPRSIASVEAISAAQLQRCSSCIPLSTASTYTRPSSRRKASSISATSFTWTLRAPTPAQP